MNGLSISLIGFPLLLVLMVVCGFPAFVGFGDPHQIETMGQLERQSIFYAACGGSAILVIGVLVGIIAESKPTKK